VQLINTAKFIFLDINVNPFLITALCIVKYKCISYIYKYNTYVYVLNNTMYCYIKFELYYHSTYSRNKIKITSLKKLMFNNEINNTQQTKLAIDA